MEGRVARRVRAGVYSHHRPFDHDLPCCLTSKMDFDGRFNCAEYVKNLRSLGFFLSDAVKKSMNKLERPQSLRATA